MAKLTSKERNKLPAKDFAVKGRKYPVEDKTHAKNALARVAQHGTPEEKKEVKAKVKAKFPSIGKDNREGRLHSVKTSRGEFRIKDNRKDGD